MSTAALPTVDVLMPAYNYAEFVGRAVQSVLDQDYPADRIRLIVVNDGSTDQTGAVVQALADQHPNRITLINQANAGPSAAINRALEEASAELVAVLDADDMWLPEKARRQAELLRDDPALGMVFCDMRVVDGEERTVRPSQVGNIGAFPRRAFARLLAQNVATQSAIMLRRGLARPLPAGVPYSDWWFALCAAQSGDVMYVPEPLALYREHGANLTSSVSGAAAVREHLKEVRFQLWALRNLDISGLTAPETQLVWAGIEQHAGGALSAAGTHFLSLATADDEGHAEAERLADEAGQADARGDWDAEAVLWLRALGAAPFDLDAHQSFKAALEKAAALAATPHPLAGIEGFVVLADAEDLLDDAQMLPAYVAALEQTGALGSVTLAIDATRLPSDSAAAQLHALVERDGLAERDDIEMVALVDALDPGQRRRLQQRASARYRREPVAGDMELPLLTPATIAEIAALLGSATATP
jgi:alpha-1,6-rhamnosyltransferase